MKKIFASLLVLAMVVLTACGANTPQTTQEFDYKVGTAAYTHTNDTYGYIEGRNGQGAVSTTMVAAVFDKTGNIVKISIDEVETNIGFDNTGRLSDFSPGEVKSKKELGDAYGMRAVSSIGKEWHEQVGSLEKWLEGKDVNSIMGGAKAKTNSNSTTLNPSMSDGVNGPQSTEEITKSGSTPNSRGMDGVMSGVNSAIDDMTDGGENYTGSTATNGWLGEDIKASVTIDTTNIQRAIEKAYRNAK